jgi:hypothetical protein
VIVEREQRRNPVAGALAAIAVAASFVALLMLLSATSASEKGREAVGSLLDADGHHGALAAATGLRVLSLVLIVFVGLHLYELVRARDEAVPPALRVLAIVAPLVVAASAVASHFSLLDAANAFTGGGARTEARADDLLHHGGLQRGAAVAAIITAIVFAGWLGWVSLLAMRVGLLTKTLGYWGVGAALATVIVPVAGQGLLMGWLGSLALLLLGWWPGGRGGAWTSGRAEPWDPGAADRRRATVGREETP